MKTIDKQRLMVSKIPEERPQIIQKTASGREALASFKTIALNPTNLI